MSKAKAKANKSLSSFFRVDFKAFSVLVRMLLSNSLSLDLKGNKKKAILKLLLSVLAFAIIAALSYLFFYLCVRFNIFSLLAFVPMDVPSIIVSILLLVSFLTSLGRVCEDLYFASDNKILLTLPTNGNTLFLARLFVCFLNTYLKSLLLEVPFLIGYFAVSGYPIYMYFALFFVWALIDLAMLLLCSLLSVPVYYAKAFLKTRALANALFSVLLIGVVLGLCVFLIFLIPSNIDIFSNWGVYFSKIQQGLVFYRTRLSFFYKTSMLYLGNFTGFSFAYFSKGGIAGLYVFLILLLALPLLYFASLLLSGPLYLRLASGSGELQGRSRGKRSKREGKTLSPLSSQLKKEGVLFFKDSSLSSGYIGVFLALPLLLSLLAKLFGAMDLNSRGEGYVQVVFLLVCLLLALSANSTIARIYSQEGGAFKLSRTYPLKEGYLISSKLVLPGFIGTLSLLACTIALCSLRSEMSEGTAYMGAGIILVYLGHLLYSAGLDFTNPKSGFGEASFFNSSENRATIMGFIVTALLSIFYYLYFQDHILWLASVQASAGFKIFLWGIFYLLGNILLYARKIKYLYKTGESL